MARVTITELTTIQRDRNGHLVSDWLFQGTSQSVVPATAAVTASAIGSGAKAVLIATDTDVQYELDGTAGTASPMISAGDKRIVAVGGGEVPTFALVF